MKDSNRFKQTEETVLIQDKIKISQLVKVLILIKGSGG